MTFQLPSTGVQVSNLEDERTIKKLKAPQAIAHILFPSSLHKKSGQVSVKGEGQLLHAKLLTPLHLGTLVPRTSDTRGMISALNATNRTQTTSLLK